MNRNDLIVVREYADESSLFGANSTDGIDVAASMAKYETMVANAIIAAYPRASVFVECGNGIQSMTVNGGHSGQMYGEELTRYLHVEQIIHDTWEAWEWVVNVE